MTDPPNASKTKKRKIGGKAGVAREALQSVEEYVVMNERGSQVCFKELGAVCVATGWVEQSGTGTSQTAAEMWLSIPRICADSYNVNRTVYIIR